MANSKLPLYEFAQQNAGKSCQKIARLLLMTDRETPMRGISQFRAYSTRFLR